MPDIFTQDINLTTTFTDVQIIQPEKSQSSGNQIAEKTKPVNEENLNIENDIIDTPRPVQHYARNNQKNVKEKNKKPLNLTILDNQKPKKEGESLFDLYQKYGIDYLEKEVVEDFYALEDTVTQENSKIKTDPNFKNHIESEINKWIIGGQFAPMYASFYNTSGLTQKESTDFSSTQNVSESYSVGEPLFAYSTGINVGFNMNKKWAFMSGVYYSKSGQEVNGALVLDSDPAYNGGRLSILNTPTGNYQPENTDAETIFNNTKSHEIVQNNADGNLILYNQTSIVQYFDYFEIPVLFKYRVIDNLIGLNLIGGLSTGFLLDNSIYAVEGDQKNKIGDATNVNQVAYNTTFGFGIDYNFTEKAYFSIEPTFRYSLRPILNNSEIKKYPYSLGLFTGFGFRL